MFIRKAAQEDALDVLAWRNDPDTRTQSRSSEVVGRAEHLAWFARAVADERRLLLIGETDAGKVGMVRFDYADEREVSINLNPEFRGQGLSRQLLLAALGWSQGPHVAYVKEDNLASVRLFERAGFTHQGTVDGLRRYARP